LDFHFFLLSVEWEEREIFGVWQESQVEEKQDLVRLNEPIFIEVSIIGRVVFDDCAEAFLLGLGVAIVLEHLLIVGVSKNVVAVGAMDLLILNRAFVLRVLELIFVEVSVFNES